MKLRSIKILALVLALASGFAAYSEKQISQATSKNDNKNKTEINTEKKDSLPIADSNDWSSILVGIICYQRN